MKEWEEKLLALEMTIQRFMATKHACLKTQYLPKMLKIVPPRVLENCINHFGKNIMAVLFSLDLQARHFKQSWILI